MKIEYTYNSKVFFAQAYGADTYGEQVYSACEQTANGCVPISDNGNTNTGSEGAPNTGFLGLSPDAAVASFSGVLLVAVAVVGAIYVVARRMRANKKKTQE